MKKNNKVERSDKSKLGGHGLWRIEKQIDAIQQHSRICLSLIRKELKRSGLYTCKKLSEYYGD